MKFRQSITQLWVAITLLFAGCGSIPVDQGRSEVDRMLLTRGQPLEATVKESLSRLLQEPITRDTALKIALVNNPKMKMSYARLGFGAAQAYEGSRIRNPVFEGSWLDPRNVSGRTFITLGLAISLSDLITLSARKKLSQAEFDALKMSVGQDIVSLLAETELAYYDYVGAELTAQLTAKIAKAGNLSAALAQRFRDAGNFSPRELAIAKSAAAETGLRSLEAQAEAMAARTRLANLLGLSIAESWRIQPTLHLPVADEDNLNELLSLAFNNRLDLQASKSQAEYLAKKYEVTGWSRWIEELEVGVERERESDGANFRGPTLHWSPPLFDQGKSHLFTAEAEMTMAANALVAKTVTVENEVRLGYGTLQNAKTRADAYRDALIPERKNTVQRAQEEVNFMLIGVFELLALKQQEFDSYQGYIKALQDYWQARAMLALAVGTQLPSSEGATLVPLQLDQLVDPKQEQENKHHHHSRSKGDK